MQTGTDGVDAQDPDDQETGVGGDSRQDEERQDDEQQSTGLGSGEGSGLGHSLTSEPEPLLGDPEDR